MRVLFLGEEDSPLVDFLKEVEGAENVSVITRKITPEDHELIATYEFAVSFGYRHIVKKEVIDLFPDTIINLHISYLPYNRGADPNLWSFLDGTPKGVTIHQMDPGLDTGDILVQEEVNYTKEDLSSETLASTYARLQRMIIELFKVNWIKLRVKQITPQPQDNSLATLHYSKHKKSIMENLPNGWETTIAELLSGDSSVQ